jgi:peptidoglycan/LPS O-acetylase OafA/YrhL
MVHAWGTTPTVGWNFPSWSISAEWLAYLLFPLVAGAGAEGEALVRRVCGWRDGALLVFVSGRSTILAPVLPGVGREFSQMTAQIGALRILPSFLLALRSMRLAASTRRRRAGLGRLLL